MARESLKKAQESHRDERSINASALQKTASNPANSVWVSASAGTGKTTVLTQRVLRLMLPQQNGAPETPPHKILCLTYTRAGASEMALRVGSALSRWAVMAPDELKADLTKLLGWPADESTLTAARRLFTQVVDTPGGLKIMTIHSFCQSILGRFSLEAQVPPHFTLLEEVEQDILLARARHIVMAKAAPGSPLRQALDLVAAQIDEESFLTLLGAMAQERKFLFDLMREWGPDGLYTALCAVLDTMPGRTPEDIIRDACNSNSIAEDNTRKACTAMAASKSEEESGFAYKIQLWLDAAPEARTDNFKNYAEIFIPKSTETPRTRNFPSKSTVNIFPESEAILRTESQRLMDVHEDIRKSLCARSTASLLHLGYEIISEFQSLKKGAGKLDYTDLILCTLDLLQGRTTDIKGENIVDWVMYKLDQGIDHILIDEAQDTNPEQWDIIETLCAEFFSGSGAREDVERTVFAVGDEKQSIFSFQRAAPEEFSRMRTAMAGRVSAAGKIFADVGLNISFRSTESVLKLVDQVFLKSEAAKGLGSGPIEHIAARNRDPGLVELWPLFESEKPEKRDPWEPPTRIVEAKGGAASLAQYIADTIHSWLESKEILPSTGRPVTPGDIMILVRKRMPFTEPLMRALKNKGIPVSGADRMILNDQISVQDLLAVASFALLPSDDLTLATILKSPLIGLSEDRLFDLAIGRTGTLWEAIKRGDSAIIMDYLGQLINLATYSTPYAFFSYILHSPCPADSQSGWRAMQARLGADIKDPLDEFLNAVLLYESERTPSLQGFLHWQSCSHTEIKREMDDGGGQVRIMTVHGAKGLEAPIVILPDTTRTARGSSRQPARRLIWPHKSGLPVPLWSPRADADCGMFEIAYGAQQEKEDEEYRRLFYVALTRAADRLYVCGYKPKSQTLNEGCWYSYAKTAFESMNNVEVREDGVLRISNLGDSQTHSQNKFTNTTTTKDGVPDWATMSVPHSALEHTSISTLRPSHPEPAAISPTMSAKNYRFLRGNITHKLLQILPEVSVDNRLHIANEFVSCYGAELSDIVKNELIKETMSILENNSFKSIFSPGSMAEVPVTGYLPDGTLLSGQIDRLAVTDKEILIVDFKTSRPPPGRQQDVHSSYIRQMQAYSDTLKAIYPGRTVRCALLWTDGPVFMPLDLT